VAKSSNPQVLLIDDGELGQVRALLEDLATGYSHLRGCEAKPPVPSVEKLFVTTGQLAVGLPCRRMRRTDGLDAIWMAVVRGDAKGPEKVLRRNGFDLLIPEPVHPAALRLLLMRAVFDGANTQGVDRVAFGDEIRVGTALRNHPAVMVDVSPRGCKFLTEKAPKLGASIGLQIPCDDGEVLSLDGVASRTNPGELEGGEHGQTAVGVRFRPMRRNQVELMKGVLRSCRSGPRRCSGVHVPTAVAPPSDDCLSVEPSRMKLTHEPEPAAASELLPRAIFAAEVDACCAGATHPVMGRDLSERGMLIEANQSLRVGQRMRLFLYGAAREEPMLIEARVGRDDGKRGLALYFDWLEPDALRRLRRLVQTLPRVPRPGDDTPAPPLLSQLLPRLKRAR
jgi:hypothetical protein